MSTKVSRLWLALVYTILAMDVIGHYPTSLAGIIPRWLDFTLVTLFAILAFVLASINLVTWLWYLIKKWIGQ